MKKLVLFDIDGTLVGGVKDSTLFVSSAEDRFTAAIRNALGLNVKRDKDFRGSTDILILAALLEGEGWDERQIQAAMPQLIDELDSVHEKTFNPASLTLLPGVTELLDALKAHGVTLGLITGNLHSVAKRKLEALGIWSYFTVGAFGDDVHTMRADLVRLAVERAGFDSMLNNVIVVGDTQKDIQAAHDAGIIHSIGVVNGFRSRQELIDAGAKAVLDDFTDTGLVMSTIGA